MGSPARRGRAGIDTQVARFGSLLSCHSAPPRAPSGGRGTTCHQKATGEPDEEAGIWQQNTTCEPASAHCGDEAPAQGTFLCSRALATPHPAQGGGNRLPMWAGIKVGWSLFPQAQGSSDREVNRKGRRLRGQEKVSHRRLVTQTFPRTGRGLRKCAGESWLVSREQGWGQQSGAHSTRPCWLCSKHSSWPGRRAARREVARPGKATSTDAAGRIPQELLREEYVPAASCPSVPRLSPP